MAPQQAIDNTQRRKWDKDEYAAKAKDRERADDEKEKAKTIRPPAGAIVERKTLSLGSIIQRDYKKELESRVGTKSIVNLDTGEGLGFMCKETGVVLRDSMAYLDHINGKKQQKALGLSMRVERSTVDQVKARFDAHKRKKQDEQAMGHLDFNKRVALAEEDEEEIRRQRAERKKAKKEAKKQEQGGVGGGKGGRAGGGSAGSEFEDMLGMDPEMAAMMGFDGFGGSNKS